MTLTHLITKWMQTRQYRDFYVCTKHKNGIWMHDQIMYLKRRKKEAIVDVNVCDVKTVVSYDVYLVAFIESNCVSAWRDKYSNIYAHDPKFFSKMGRLLKRIIKSPNANSLFIRRSYKTKRDIKCLEK